MTRAGEWSGCGEQSVLENVLFPRLVVGVEQGAVADERQQQVEDAVLRRAPERAVGVARSDLVVDLVADLVGEARELLGQELEDAKLLLVAGGDVADGVVDQVLIHAIPFHQAPSQANHLSAHSSTTVS